MRGHGGSEISLSRRGQIGEEEEESDTRIKEVLKLRRKIDAELEELEQQRNTVPYNSDSPFTKSIQTAPPDLDVTIPELDTFDGTGDPYCHVSQYENLMDFYGFDDAAFCKLFTLTLKDAAYGWYQDPKFGFHRFVFSVEKEVFNPLCYLQYEDYLLFNGDQTRSDGVSSFIY